jgi:hypothetical protein
MHPLAQWDRSASGWLSLLLWTSRDSWLVSTLRRITLVNRLARDRQMFVGGAVRTARLHVHDEGHRAQG